MPSPHGIVHSEGVLMQMYPVSILQVALQPSRLAVLLSSQVSGEILIPSPHKGVQTSLVVKLPPVQVHVCNAPTQFDLHPLPSVQLPSSQVSSPFLLLFPHTSQILKLKVLSHLLLDSTRQPEEQPSPLAVLLSSHLSLKALTPSPHVEVQTEGCPEQLYPCST